MVKQVAKTLDWGRYSFWLPLTMRESLETSDLITEHWPPFLKNIKNCGLLCRSNCVCVTSQGSSNPNCLRQLWQSVATQESFLLMHKVNFSMLFMKVWLISNHANFIIKRCLGMNCVVNGLHRENVLSDEYLSTCVSFSSHTDKTQSLSHLLCKHT